MKILHIAYSGLGGHGNVFFSMIDADVKHMHQYEVIFFGNEPLRDAYAQMARTRSVPWHYVHKKPGMDFSAHRQMGKIIASSLPDIIFLHSSSYIFAARMAVYGVKKKIRIIVRETQANHLKTKQNWIGLSAALLIASKVVFLSEEYRNEVKRKLALFFSAKKTAVIPNGIDLDVYKPGPSKDNEGINIGMQSRLTDIKDHATLIAAFAEILKMITDKPVKLFIAGDGSTRAILEKQAEELGIKEAVYFTGMLEEAQLPAFINMLDIYVHATYGETMSTAIMQVMACRLPVIASDVAGVNNMIKNGVNGLLVPVKNVKALQQAMLQLADNPGLSDTLAQNAYTFAVENYSNKKMFDRYNEIFLK